MTMMTMMNDDDDYDDEWMNEMREWMNSIYNTTSCDHMHAILFLTNLNSWSSWTAAAHILKLYINLYIYNYVYLINEYNNNKFIYVSYIIKYE